MNFTTDRRILHTALASVARIIGRSSLPVLSNVHIETKGDNRIKLRATDLELAIEREVNASVHAGGAITLPAKTLSEIVAAFPEGEVSLWLDENDSGAITCGSSKFRIHGLPATEFPPAVEVGEGIRFSITEGAFHSQIQRVSGSMSKDDLRAVLTGALFELDGDTLRMVTTDTYRLTVANAALWATVDRAQAIIPGRALQELLKLTNENSDALVSCQLGENQARFTVGTTSLTTRLIEGTFPKYERIIPQTHDFRLTMDALEFRKAVKRAAIVAQEGHLRIDLEASEGSLAISASTNDLGSSCEELECSLEGEDICFALNAGYLAASIDAIGGETIALEGTDPLKPMVLRAVGDGSCFVVIVPLLPR